MAFVEALKTRMPYHGTEVLNTKDIEEIRYEKNLFDLAYQREYDDKGRVIKEIHRRIETNTPYRKIYFTYSNQKETQVTIENTYVSWDTTFIGTKFYERKTLVKEENLKISRYRLVENGDTSIQRKDRLSKVIYRYDDFENLLTKVIIEGNNLDTFHNNTYQYNLDNKIIDKKKLESFHRKNISKSSCL
jgi:hypothetical protein